MPFFRKQSPMQMLQDELASLRARAEKLNSRHAAAQAAFLDAKIKLQRHLLESDLDADDKARAKLETAVAACALTRDSYSDALDKQQAKIAELELTIATERATAERNAAADKLARDLDEIEQALPDYLAAVRRLAHALETVSHFHHESNQMSVFALNAAAQIEVASAFALQELRAMVERIETGEVPIPAQKPVPAAVTVSAPPTQRTVGRPTHSASVTVSDPIVEANFTPFDRGVPERKFQISVPKL
jgi:DNA repair exonuclease SbcCD ATPase subunit